MRFIKSYFPLLGVVLIALLLRLFNFAEIPLWHDEAFSALMIRYGWGEMFYRLGLDVHPPMYYAFLKFWHYFFGDTVASLRGMSVMFGAASVAAAWAFAKEAFKNEKAAMWAAVLVALNPFQLRYVTEARMYTMGSFFVLLAGYFLVRSLNLQKLLHEQRQANMPNLPFDLRLRRKMVLSWLGFSACLAVSILTHYYLLFSTAALLAYGVGFLLLHRRWGREKFLWLAGAAVLAGLAFLPWLKTFLFQYRQVSAGYWISKMNAWSIPGTAWDMLVGLSRDASKPGTRFWMAVIAAFSAFLLIRFLRRTESFHKWLAGLAVVAPFAGALLFALLARLSGSDSSVYLDRYFLFSSVYFSVIVAVWLKELPARRLAAALFFGYCVFNLFVFFHYWDQLDVASKPGMRGAARFITANAEPGHHVFVGTSFEFFNYKYYALTSQRLPGGVAPRLYTGGRTKVSQMSHVEGNSLLSDQDLAADFAAPASGDVVWLLWTNAFGSGKPDVPSRWVKIDERSYPDVRPYPGTVIFVSEYRVN